MIGTYQIINIQNGKYYYGSTKNLKNRWITHRSKLKQNSHINIYLQRAWNKYGEDNFIFLHDIYFPTIEEAREKEEIVIQEPNNFPLLYNISRFASGGDLISYHPNKREIVKRISLTLKLNRAKIPQKERVKRWGKFGPKNGMFGKTHKKEVKQRLSNLASLRTGDKNPFYGKKHTKEVKQKLRKLNKGKVPVNRKKISIDGISYNSLAEASYILEIQFLLFLID